jgi:UDP-N-acetyl-D-mannosaminuronic acid dehydrogenase
MSDGFDVVVVGGAGHVGAPLAMLLADRGLRTLVYDTNAAAVASLMRGEMPFIEEGGSQTLRRALGSGRLGFTDSPASVRGIPTIIVTIGTPIDEYHNPRLTVITRCLDSLIPYLSDDQTIILRSTVFPGVTAHVDRYLASRGRKPGLAFCPERVVQGKAIEELQHIPQIVSGITREATECAAKLFERIAPSVVRMEPMEAEFAKLISNAYRYIQFAAANQFYMLAKQAGIDYSTVLRGMKEDYPRMRDIPGPGFAAGPCLMKDTMQLAAFGDSHFSLGHEAMLVNEGLPNFIVDQLRRRHALLDKPIGILGMAFKADIDDIRESLSYKLGKILRFHGARVMYSDEYAIDPTFITKEALIAASEIIIVGVPHSAYRGLEVPSTAEVVDLWEILGRRPNRD